MNKEQVFEKWQEKHPEFQNRTLGSYEDWDPETGEPICQDSDNCVLIGAERGATETIKIKPLHRITYELVTCERKCPVLLFSELKEGGIMTHQYLSRNDEKIIGPGEFESRGGWYDKTIDPLPNLKPVNPSYSFCPFIKHTL